MLKQGWHYMSRFDKMCYPFVWRYIWKNYSIDIRRWDLTPEDIKKINERHAATAANQLANQSQ